MRVWSRAMSSGRRVVNLNAGPAGVPLPVLLQAQKDLTNWNGCGMGVMEMSHRSKEYESIHVAAVQDLKTLLQVPDTHQIMFIQGGASQQFAAIPLNMPCGATADYLVTGAWSEAAAKEAKRLRPNVAVVADGKGSNYTAIPPFSPNSGADYLAYCENETVHGVEFNEVPQVDAPLVCDMSSNFISRPVDVSKFGVIFAGAQKNVGPPGITIVIAHSNYLRPPRDHVPLMLNWKTMADSNSLYNTVPTFTVYMAGLVFKWALELGGLQALAARSEEKAALLYDFIDNSNGFYRNPVAQTCRSRMNVPFLLQNEDVTKKFISAATKEGFEGLKGHRSVGGCRASIYNAVSVADVKSLVEFMAKFQKSS